MMKLNTKSKKSGKNNLLSSSPSLSLANRNMTGGFMHCVRWTLGLSVCAGILYGITVGLFSLYRLATTSDFFALENVDIRGAKHFRREDMLRTAGLEAGKNTLSIDIYEVENALSQNPWVSSVAVKRKLPNTYEINVTERIPAFWILKDGNLHYVDRKGVLIAPVEAGNFLSLPTLEILAGGENMQSRVGDLMDALHKANLPLDLAAVSTIRLSSARGLEIAMENMRLTLCISPDDWDNNLRRLNSVLRDLARRGELKNTREIWLAEGSVWVIMEQPEANS